MAKESIVIISKYFLNQQTPPKILQYTPLLPRSSLLFSYIHTHSLSKERFRSQATTSRIPQMSSQNSHIEHCKGVNGFDKVILREIRGCSVEVFLFLLSLFLRSLLCAFLSDHSSCLCFLWNETILVIFLVRNLRIRVKMLAALLNRLL